jgi:hypothetical protein
MKTNHSYGMNIFTILIVIGVLQLIWSWSPWIILYRFVAVVCLFFMLLVLVSQLLIAKDKRFFRNQIRQKQPLKFLTLMRSITMLLVAWLMKDSWAWWLTVSLVTLSIGIRWMELRKVISKKMRV